MLCLLEVNKLWYNATSVDKRQVALPHRKDTGYTNVYEEATTPEKARLNFAAGHYEKDLTL